MKQHITKKQLNELSEKPFLELEKWKMKKGYGSFPYREGKWKGDTLSIGQMIGFLYDNRWNKKAINISFIQGQASDGESWSIVPEDLCDDLWQAVKEVLNDN